MDKQVQKDHDILHFFADNPKSATTGHSLVRNDMYGINHEVAYEQELLTKQQIADMHNALIKTHEPVGHKTPIGSPTTKEQTHIDRWDEVVIRNPQTKNELTKRDIYRYYSSPTVKKQLFQQIQNDPVMMRQAMEPGESWVKRNPVIRKNVNDAGDPEDLQYYIDRRHVEFNKTMPALTDKLVIDLDPGVGLSLEDVKKVAKYVEQLLQNQSYIKDVSMQFSGNRGIHVWGHLTTKTDIDKLREKLKTTLAPIKTMNGVNVTLRQSPGQKSVRLDLSSMKNLGAIKAEGSLDIRTGYISTEILPSHLDSFDPEVDASINTKILKPAYSFKDEKLV